MEIITKERFYTKKGFSSLKTGFGPEHHYRNAPIDSCRSWKCKHVKNDRESSLCISFSWLLLLLGHPQHLTIIRRRIELHATNNYFSVLHDNCLNLTQLACNYLLFNALRKVRFLLGRGWCAGASEGRVLSKFSTNWGGSNLFYSQPDEGHSFFGEEKNYSMSLLFCIYKQSYQSRLI